jgi:enhancing lycopene biosynthesis protein 2
MTVDINVLETIEAFFHLKKPMGFICISPIIAAKVLGTKSGHPGIELTLGKRRKSEEWPYSDSIEVADNFGNKHVERDIDQVHVDPNYKIVTTPAYMKGTAAPHEVYEGVGKLVAEVLKLTNNK